MDGSSAVLEHEGRKERLERFRCGVGRIETEGVLEPRPEKPQRGHGPPRACLSPDSTGCRPGGLSAHFFLADPTQIWLSSPQGPLSPRRAGLSRATGIALHTPPTTRMRRADVPINKTPGKDCRAT